MTEPVTIDLEPRDREFLAGHFDNLAGGLRQDLDRHRGQLRDPDATARELRAYEALAAGVRAGALNSDDEMRARAAEAARENDRENRWPRVTREHLAFGALLGCLGVA